MERLEHKIKKLFRFKINSLANKAIIYSLTTVLTNCGAIPKDDTNEKLEEKDSSKQNIVEVSEYTEDTISFDSSFESSMPETNTKDIYSDSSAQDIPAEKDIYPEISKQDIHEVYDSEVSGKDAYPLIDLKISDDDTNIPKDSYMDIFHGDKLIQEDYLHQDTFSQDISSFDQETVEEKSDSDASCLTKLFYQDKDDDGFGEKNKTQLFCSEKEIPPGYVFKKEEGWDCNDENKLINPLAEETCDSLDNDCDGKVDEGLTLKQPCGISDAGECSYGVELNFCLGGEYVGWQICDAMFPKEEVCDGKDNDCDGKTDEELILKQQCGVTDIGDCTYGTEFNFCLGKYTGWQICDAVFPTKEICDGKDNNCNGLTDEGLILEQKCGSTNGGECDFGVEYKYCKNGNYTGWMDCTAIFPIEEVCNSLDDDCDGKTDEELLLEQPCGVSNLGKCTLGTEINFCTEGQYTGWKDCTAVFPTKEICDGKDNNCDGKTDEGLTLEKTCGISGVGNCVLGIESNYCEDGEYTGWLDCNAIFPSLEICNGLDDDCNGLVDEGGTLEQSCGITGAGECTLGFEFKYCISGEYSEWVGCKAILPVLETCDYLDNNCNGAVDENFNVGEKCFVGEGICESEGTVKCTLDGFDTYCDAVPGLPATEKCDNLDNNCDGLTDENLVQACYSICGEGKEICTVGAWINCTAPLPELEVCDYFDNDCDGLTDESFNVGEKCYSGEGVCKTAGSFECTANGFDTYCDAVPELPEQEKCDTLDNDCDGLSDEDLIKVCYSSCGDGLEICVNGTWTNCDAPKPQLEICDYADNNCNGLVDEEFGVGEVCYIGTGECKTSGVTKCNADGFTTYCTAVPKESKVEICNALDDDCNGVTDENLSQSCNTACGSGLENCLNGKWENCTAPQPQPEICDGKDNDCNGKIDELIECCPLVGYWNFDEGAGNIAYDSSGKGNNGAISGATWIVGKINGALNFDGASDYVSIGYHFNNLGLDGSLCMWFKPNADFKSGSPSQDLLFSGGGLSHNIRITLAGEGNDAGRLVFQKAVSSNSWGNLSSKKVSWPKDNWQHACFTFENTNMFMYINGALENNTSSGCLGLHNNATNAFIGSFWWGKYTFDGIIDEVKVYNCALTEEQVLIEYAKGKKN